MQAITMDDVFLDGLRWHTPWYLNAKFYSGKALDIRYKVSFGVMVVVILGLVLISTYPPLTIFCLFLIYALFWLRIVDLGILKVCDSKENISS
jgi:hypothetical protein